MADEIKNLSIPPETKEADRRNVRRHSMGKARTVDSDERRVPRDRRASVGSCHNFCKFENQHSFEMKPRDTLMKKAMKKSLDDQNSDQVVALLEWEKTIIHVAELKDSPDSETSTADATDLVKLEVPVKSPSRQSRVGMKVMKETNKLVAGTLKEKSVSSPGSSANMAGTCNNNSKGLRISKPIEMEVAVNPPDLLDRSSVDVVANLPSIKKHIKLSPSLKSQNTVRTQTKEANTEVQEKTLYVVNMETKKQVAKSDHIEKNTPGLHSKPPPPPPPPSSSSPRKRSSLYKPPSSASCSPLSSRGNGKNESKSARSNVETTFHKCCEIDDIKKGKSATGNKKGSSLKMLQSNGKDSSSMNLKMRKGKVVDFQLESKSPRKLKLKGGRSLGSNQKNKDDQRKRLKKVLAGESSKDSVPPSEKIALRHEVVQGDKKTSVLFNNIIEETVSKLVRTRKSKVKALVGAFEKVISLQDKRLLRTIA